MNWGNKLLLTFIVFGTGMFYLVYRSMRANFELVEKDYYKSELRYQEVIDGSNRAHALATFIDLKQTDSAIILTMPKEVKGKIITGNVLFYCSYDSKKDRKFALDITDNGTQTFSDGIITAGNYTVKLNWISEKQHYYAEKRISVK